MGFSLSFPYPHPTDVNNLRDGGDGKGTKQPQHSNNLTVIFHLSAEADFSSQPID